MQVSIRFMSFLVAFTSLAQPTLAFTSRQLASKARLRNSIGRAMSSTAITEAELIQDMLVRIRNINRMPEDIRASLLDFKVDGKKLGKIRPAVAEMLCNIPYGDTDGSVFLWTNDGKRQFITLSEHAGTTIESRTAAVATVTEKLRDEGFVTGWRDELFPVGENFYSDPMFLIERSATDVLGALDYGVHINGLVQESTLDEPKMWIGRRSATKSKFPGMLDHLVAGGQPAGLSLMENVLKECEEEAGVPEDLVRAGAHAVGAISYEGWNPKTDKISRVILFNYDLYLPKSFVPKPVDGEVEEFFLWTIDEVKESMRLDFHDPIKPNCYVVIIDYLLRKGFISPEVDGYLDILKELRSGDCQ